MTKKAFSLKRWMFFVDLELNQGEKSDKYPMQLVK